MTWIKKHNIALWIVSLIIAVVLWVYVTIVLDPVRERHIEGIAVEYTDRQYLESRNLTLVDSGNKTVSATFSGNIMELQKLRKEDIKAVVSLAEIRNSGVFYMTYELTGAPAFDTSPRLSRATITVDVDSLDDRNIPLRLDLKADLAPGYRQQKEVVFEPSVVRVRGAKRILDTIAEAVVTYESSIPLDKTVNALMTYTFYDRNGGLVDPVDLSYTTYQSEVQMTIPITYTKEVPVELVFVEGGGITADNIDYTYSQNTIVISGDAAVLSDIQKLELGTIDCATLAGNEQRTYPLRIPEGVTNETGVNEVMVDLRIVGVTTRTVTVGEGRLFVVADPPDGYRAAMVTKELNVQIRGPESEVNSITANDIRVIAEMEESESLPGTHSVAPRIVIDGYSHTGVVELGYTVTVDISAIEPLTDPATGP